MGTEVTPKFYEVLQTHLDTGVPVEDLNLSPAQRERMLVCLDAYRHLDDRDPFADLSTMLRTRYKRTIPQIREDKKVINFLIAQLNTDTKELSRYRIIRAAEKTMRMGDQAGDAKTIIEGAKMLYKAEGLDKPESMLEDLSKSVHSLPPVFTTDVTKINSDLTNISDEQREKLLRKYNVTKDKTQEMVEAKIGFFVPAGSTVPDTAYEEYEEFDEEENYDDDAI